MTIKSARIGFGFVKNFTVDITLPHDGRDARRRQYGLRGDDRDRLLGGGALLRLEIGRHIFGQHSRRDGQHVDQPDRASLLAIITALAIAGLASSASARSIGTKIRGT